MTALQISKINQAIAECSQFIDLESARNADLRPQETQEYLDFCIQHRANLIAMKTKSVNKV